MRQRLFRYLDFVNGLFKGWKTLKKILVIESDDWGALRLHNQHTYEALLKKNVPVDKDNYDKYDCLENSDDMSRLAEVLLSIKSGDGQSPVMTLNTVMGNPNFESIEKSNFETYSFINLENSYEKYGEGKQVLDVFKNWIKEGVFQPQFHGREHLNVPAWLNALQNGDYNLLKAFEHRVFSVTSSQKIGDKSNATRAFDSSKSADIAFFKASIVEGLQVFRDTFGFSSKTMIAPSYTWGKQIEEAAFESGVIGFQGIRYQFMPSPKIERIPVPRYTGQSNNNQQIYLVRNCFFEPSIASDRFNVDRALQQIMFSFRTFQPAILSSHRLNYIGGISRENRNKNLEGLQALLKKVVRLFPEVIFASSDILLDTMIQKHSGEIG